MDIVSICLFAGPFLGFLTVAAHCDLSDLRIPNRLTLTMAATGPLAVWLFGPGADAVPGALLTGAVALAVGWALFALGWLGGGDAKLAAASTLWLGAEASGVFLIATALFGALLAASLLLLGRWQAGQALVGESWRTRLQAETIPVPYAVAMAPAGVLALVARFAGPV